jgi:hypothetical protein
MYRTQNKEVHQPQIGWQFGDNMYYVCIEDNIVTTILNYRPNVPASIEVVEITDVNMADIENDTHYFNVDTKSVTPHSNAVITQKNIDTQNIEHKEFLSSTDWKVLRHTREKALGIETSLTEDEYLALEQERENAARAIR